MSIGHGFKTDLEIKRLLFSLETIAEKWHFESFSEQSFLARRNLSNRRCDRLSHFVLTKQVGDRFFLATNPPARIFCTLSYYIFDKNFDTRLTSFKNFRTRNYFILSRYHSYVNTLSCKKWKSKLLLIPPNIIVHSGFATGPQNQRVFFFSLETFSFLIVLLKNVHF